MMHDDLIIGGGGSLGKGGGGGGGTPSEAKDNLESTSYAQSVDLIGEGEIEGFATPSRAGLTQGTTTYNNALLKDIYFDNTPILRSTASNTAPTTGDFNFKNVKVYTRFGTKTQSRLPFGSAISEEISVGIQVENGVPITRTISDTNVDQVRVTITVPQLQKFETDGDITGSSVQLQIRVQYNGGGFATVITDTIKGRTPDAYQRDYLVDLRSQSPSNFPVDIRVVRVTANSDSAKVANAFTWTSYTEIVQAKLNYPHSALVGIRVDAEQFNNIPVRKYRVRGLKISIPSNATVDNTTGRLIYSGTWNGTFQAAQWCSDPAWCLWNLLTSTRFGLGTHVQAAQLDKWAFYSASQYCSALVPDGFEGTEPRFSCNAIIQAPTEAYKLINDLCSVFRAMPYWSIGSLTIAQDKPVDSSYLFTLANVTEEGFSYSGSDVKARPNVAIVQYLDINSRDTAYEQVEDRIAIQKYGLITQEVTAFACTSRGQASRIGDWILYSSQYETEIISFTSSIDAGVVVRPGQVIDIADPVRSGSRRGGRITAATASSITIDNADGLPASGTVSVIMPDGTIENRTCTRSGVTLTPSSAFSTAPNANTVWVLSDDTIQTSQWRVLTVTEQDSCQYAVTALSYNSSKYDYVERDKTLQFRDATNLNERAAAPTNLALTETLYTYQDQVRAKVLISWRPVVGVSQYRVRWRKSSANWSVYTTAAPDHEILNITPGSFDVEVYSLDTLLRPSTTALTGTINALGKTAPPANVTGLTYALDSSLGVTLSWNAVSDLDINDYEIRRGTSWDTATFITRVKATSYKIGYLDDGTYTYLVKARDTSGALSVTAASSSITVTPPGTITVTSTTSAGVAIIQWTTALGSYLPAYYEVRYGSSYATGASIGQFKTTSTNVPITWSGSRTFWVAAVDPVGNVGTPGSTVVTVTASNAPVINYSFNADSAVLTWNEVNGTLPTKLYEIRRGASYSAASVLATIQATSYTVKVNWSGSQTFWITAIDQNNNLGTPGSVDVAVVLPGPTTFTSSFAGDQAVMTWSAVKGSIDTAYYQIRRGTTFATATVIGTIQGTSYSVKVDWSQTQRFWVAAVDIAGNVGSGTALDIVVPSPSQPTISQQVIDNNVLLQWNDCTTILPIVYYEVRKGSTWATATLIGTKQGRFTTVFETVSGTYTYWLAGVDSGGNVGTPGSITAKVSQPPDYALQLNQNSTFSGTKTNIFVDGNTLYANVNTTETWQSHFTTRGWTTPQDQINAGYTLYGLPSATTGSYEETIDYGAVVPASRIAITMTKADIIGATVVAPTISVRKLVTDPWTDYANLSDVYATDFRYIKLLYNFTSAGGDDLLQVTAINTKLDVKYKTDGGTGTANSGDSGGTSVNFGVSFTDVQSISVTPTGTTARIAIYDFVDIPNPTSFKVLLFDTSGTRVTGGFSWIAKGV